MNAFDLNRKEYIRVNNNDGGDLTQFKKVKFLTSFVVSADAAKQLPSVFDSSTARASNDNLILNAEQFCYDAYPDSEGYACYISEMFINTITSDGKLIPAAKVNVYAMDGRDL